MEPSSETPHETPFENPLETPLEAPLEMSSEALSEAPSEAPCETPPSETPQTPAAEPGGPEGEGVVGSEQAGASGGGPAGPLEEDGVQDAGLALALLQILAAWGGSQGVCPLEAGELADAIEAVAGTVVTCYRFVVNPRCALGL